MLHSRKRGHQAAREQVHKSLVTLLHAWCCCPHTDAGLQELRYPSPVLCEKRSDSSWLSCESDIDLELSYPRSSESCTSSLRKCQPKKKRKFSWKPSPRMTSDAIIGLSDGMTVPFALTAGLASLGDTRLVVLGGLAELIAGAISMGLGGLLGAKSEA